MGDDEFSAVFEDVFSLAPSSVEARGFLAALGEEYPSGLDTYSWVSRTELWQAADHVSAIDAQHLVDLGCGRGGPGLWVAKVTGARLTGVDVAHAALAHARKQALEVQVVAQFAQGTFEDTGLPDASVDAVVSFDAFLFTPDKGAAFAEIRRILRPGGRLFMTSWDYHTQPRNRPPQIDDHRPLATAAGLTVLEYAETTDWRRRCTTLADYMLEHAQEAAAEAGIPLEQMRDGLLDMRASIDCMSRRFLLVAQN